MPRFEPFPGTRYAVDQVDLDQVIAPPYDVISPDELGALEGRSPYNAVRVEEPRGRYQDAATLFSQWLQESVLVHDPEPRFYGYRMSFPGEDGTPRTTEGVIGALGIETPGDGDVLPHEHTTPKAKSDRLDLLRATRVNLSPIWGLSMANGLGAALGLDDPPDHAATDDDGVRHELWAIGDVGRVTTIKALVESAPVVIADGHHRYETAHTYRNEQNASTEGPEGLVMTLVVELSPDQLEVRAIHRLLRGLPDGFRIEDALAPHFELSPVESDADQLPQVAGGPLLVTRDGRWVLEALPPTTTAAQHDLDSSRLDVALAALPPHELTFQHGVREATAAVAAGDAQAAVLLRPATVEQITETGRSRTRMPPKTTFFWPKPRTGMVFRALA